MFEKQIRGEVTHVDYHDGEFTVLLDVSAPCTHPAAKRRDKCPYPVIHRILGVSLNNGHFVYREGTKLVLSQEIRYSLRPLRDPRVGDRVIVQVTTDEQDRTRAGAWVYEDIADRQAAIANGQHPQNVQQAVHA